MCSCTSVHTDKFFACSEHENFSTNTDLRAPASLTRVIGVHALLPVVPLAKYPWKTSKRDLQNNHSFEILFLPSTRTNLIDWYMAATKDVTRPAAPETMASRGDLNIRAHAYRRWGLKSKTVREMM